MRKDPPKEGEEEYTNIEEWLEANPSGTGV